MTTIQRLYRPVRTDPTKPDPKPISPPVEPRVEDRFFAAVRRAVVDLKPKPPPERTPQQRLENDPAFQALNPGVQQAVLETVSNPDLEPEGVDTLIAAVTSPGFGLLSTQEAEDFLEYAGNTIPGHGEAIREEIADHLASDEFQKPRIGWFPLPVALGQRSELLQISRGDEALPGETPVGSLPAGQRDVTVTGPEPIGEYDFETGEVEAERYTYEVDGRDVEVIYPVPAPDGAPSPEELETLFESLPDLAAVEYDRVLIEPNDTDRGASASTNGEGQIRIYPIPGRSLERLQSTLVHEAAHNLSKSELGDTSSIPVDGELSDLSPGWERWAEAAEADGHYVSGYAHDSAVGDNDDHQRRFGEDFAETVELYYQVKGTPAEAEFARLYPNRYDILLEVLG